MMCVICLSKIITSLKPHAHSFCIHTCHGQNNVINYVKFSIPFVRHEKNKYIFHFEINRKKKSREMYFETMCSKL